MIRLAFVACLPLLAGCSGPVAFGMSTTLDEAASGQGGQSWIAVGAPKAGPGPDEEPDHGDD